MNKIADKMSYQGVVWRRKGFFIIDKNDNVTEFIKFDNISKVGLNDYFAVIEGVHCFFHCNIQSLKIYITKITEMRTNSLVEDNVTLKKAFMTDLLENWKESQR